MLNIRFQNSPGTEPDVPPVPPPYPGIPPVVEPEPDRLPDETPLPNPDENDDPPLQVFQVLAETDGWQVLRHGFLGPG